MKFDSELARQILLDLEDTPPVTAFGDIVLDGYSQEEISYHIKMLSQANLVEAADASGFGNFHWKVRSLTYDGHKFLDEIKNDTTWAKIKSIAKTQGIQLTLVSIKEIVAHYLKTKTGLG